MNTHSAHWYIDRSSDYLEIGRWDQALNTAQQGLAYYPQNSGLLVAIGEVHFNRENYAAANSASQQAIAADPVNAYAHLLKARSLLQLDGAGGALTAARIAQELDPADPNIAIVHALALQGTDRASEAASLAETFIANHPRSIAGHIIFIHLALDKLRRLEIRWGWFIFGLLISRGFVLLFLGLFWLWLRFANRIALRGIDNHVRALLELAPDDPYVLRLAGEVLHAQGRWLRSVDHHMMAAADDPTHTDIDNLITGTVIRLTAWDIATGLATLTTAAIATATLGTNGRFLALFLFAIPAALWAIDRRRRAHRALPPALHKHLKSPAALLGPIIATALFALAFLS